MKRTMSAAYYSKIYDWFSNQQIKTSESEHVSTHRGTSSMKSEDAFESSKNSLNMYMSPPSNRTVLSKEQDCNTNKKRNTKNEIKWIEDNIDTFIISKTNLSDRSSKVYRNVLEDFNKFLLSIDPAAVLKYLRWKFNLDSNLEDKNIILQETALKYLAILTQYFRLKSSNLWLKDYDKILFDFIKSVNFQYDFFTIAKLF